MDAPAFAAIGPTTLLALFLVFCRVGACLMLMPGIGGPRVPARMRLFAAIAASLALAPMLMPLVQPAIAGPELGSFAPLVVSELIIGGLVGLTARVFFLALQTTATAASNAIGFGGLPGPQIEEGEPAAPFVSIITLGAATLLFALGLHGEILRGLAQSYKALPVSGGLEARLALRELADALAESFPLALRIASPFIIYGVIVNFAIGVANKLTPQIPIYFISLPFVIGGGLLLFYFAGPDMLRLFMSGFEAWLAHG